MLWFRQGKIPPFRHHFCTLNKCRGGNNDAELWFGRKIGGDARYSDLKDQNGVKNMVKTVFDSLFLPFRQMTSEI